MCIALAMHDGIYKKRSMTRENRILVEDAPDNKACCCFHTECVNMTSSNVSVLYTAGDDLLISLNK